MRETLVLVFVGILIGFGTALALTEMISNILFGLAPNDPKTLGATIGLMVAFAALAAGFLPARQAARVDPLVALRYE